MHAQYYKAYLKSNSAEYWKIFTRAFTTYIELIKLGSFKILRNHFISGKCKTSFQLYCPQNSHLVELYTSDDCNVI